MNDIIFISSALQQPRHQKRIDLLRETFKTTVYYFNRNKYKENIKSYEKNATLIGSMADGKYISRTLLLLKLFRILKNSTTQTAYCTSPEQALIAIAAGKKVILELGDLYQLDGKGRFLRWLDKIIISQLSGLILTSPFFFSGYYKKYEAQLKDKVLIIENKLPKHFAPEIEKYRTSFSKEKTSARIRLGIIGSLVFRRPLEAVKELILSRDDIELHIYGDGLFDIFNGVDRCFYHGPFKSPEDLPSIYKNIDINIILYENQNNNVKLALPNKLYESIAFLRPIICARNVALTEIVETEELGISSDLSNIGLSVDAIIKNHTKYIDRMSSMPREKFIDDSKEKLAPFLIKITTQN